MTAKDSDYSLEAAEAKAWSAPELDYLPSRTKSFKPRIGLIGCGGITWRHLTGYRTAGYEVVAFCDLDPEAAESRRDEYNPSADVYTDYRDVLERNDINVIDAALHPKPREQVLRDALAAGKHVLSQKPFVVDLAVGAELADLANAQGVKLAVNQNGRWAPHVSYMQCAIREGIVGQVSSIDLSVQWNHNWVTQTPFNNIPHLLLYDFAIHWFDMVNYYLAGSPARRVSAMWKRFEDQEARPPLGASILIEFENALATLSFNGNARFGPQDRSLIVGSKGTLLSQGPSLGDQTVTVTTAAGAGSPRLEGAWFSDGFDGTMSELLCAIEDDREPSNGAADNLKSLSMALAAMASADSGQPVNVGDVTAVKDTWLAY